MNTFANFIVQFRIAILTLTVIATAFFCAMLPYLGTDDDVMQFLPKDAPDIKLFNSVNKRFGGLDVAIIGVEADSLLTKNKIADIRAMTNKIADIEGVFDVLSFTEIPNPQPAPDGLRVTPLVMDILPRSKQELAKLKQTILSNENAVGNLISANGKAAMILCFLGGDRPPIHIAQDIKNTASKMWTPNKIFFGGSPFVRLHVAGGTKKDLVKLTPLVALVVLIVTFIIVRNPIGVMLALGTVGIAIIWLLGLMALRGDGLTIVGSSLPTILMAIGGAYGIHILVAYFNGKEKTVHARIQEMMRHMGPPVIASGITTAAGFLSFLAMDIAPLRDFGLHAAIGISITALLALTAIPAILSFQKRPPKPISQILPIKPLGDIGSFAARHRIAVLLISIVLAGAGLAGISRVAPDATLESFFAKDSQPARANSFLVRHFGGSNYLQVYFEGDMRSPFVLSQLQKIVEFSRSLDSVVQVSAITDSLIMMSEAMGGRADIPITNRRAGSLYPFLEGTAAIEQMISKEKDAGLVQIRLANISAEQVEATVTQIRHFIEKEIPRGIKAVQIGQFALPKEAFKEYSSPIEKDRDGQIVQKSRTTQIHQPDSPKELSLKLKKVQQDVAKRVIRLAIIHDGHYSPKDAQQKISALLKHSHATESIIPGKDLNDAVMAIVHEHIVEDYAFLDIAPPAVATEAQLFVHARQTEEWNSRQELVVAEMKHIAGSFINIERMTRLLKQALPLTSTRDPEGLEITAKAMALDFSMSQSRIKAERLILPTLNVLQIKTPSPKLRDAVIWALTDLDLPVYGFADTGKNASTILARVTGAPVINVALCTSTIDNQLKSLTVATVVLILVLSILFRSLGAALKGMIPTLFTLSLAVGVMGLFSIPIDLTTSMIAAIALGIGVDYSIHFLWRRRRRGESLGKTTAGVGPSIASNAIQVASGFSVLCISNMVPMQRFGMLVALTMLLAAVATFILLPALRAEGRAMAIQERKQNAEADAPRAH